MKTPNTSPDMSYKHYHEEYMSNNDGTTSAEVFLAVAVVPAFAVMHILLLFLRHKQNFIYTLTIKTFLLEFCSIVIPTIAALTVLSNWLVQVLIATLICCLVFSLLLYNKNKANHLSKRLDKGYHMKKRPCVTFLRAITNIITAVCILAVDFKIFPQRFSKTETFGFSLMDTGVGLYVSLNAVVAPETRGVASYLTVRHTFISSIPLLVLGILRVLATQMLNYQQHTSEYGIHWNFFFTLAFTKVLSSLLVSKLPYLKWTLFLLMSLSIITVYEVSLYCGLKEWMLGDITRSDFLTSNREGIFSLFGYVAVYFNGLALGQLLLEEKTFTLRKNLKLLGILLCVVCICWLSTYKADKFLGVSRRLTNMGYYIWIITFTISTLCLALSGEIVSLIACLSFKNNKIIYPTIPLLFEASNCHGLVFFLLANILTGLVNLSIKTLYTPPIESFVILTLYMLMCCGITCIFHVKKKCKNV